MNREIDDTLVRADWFQETGRVELLSEDQKAVFEKSLIGAFEGKEGDNLILNSLIDQRLFVPKPREAAFLAAFHKIKTLAESRNMPVPLLEKLEEEKRDDSRPVEVYRLTGAAPVFKGWRLSASLVSRPIENSMERSVSVLEFETDGCPEEYRLHPDRCDYCGQRRSRTHTFVLRSKTEGYKIVGSNCAKQFLENEDLKVWLGWSEFLAATKTATSPVSSEGWETWHKSFHRKTSDQEIPLNVFLAGVLQYSRSHGYVGGSESYHTRAISTGQRTFFGLLNSEISVSDEDLDTAQKIIDWAENQPRDTNYWKNLDSILFQGKVSRSPVNLAASLWRGYRYSEIFADGAVKNEYATIKSRIHVTGIVIWRAFKDFGERHGNYCILQTEEGHLYSVFKEDIREGDKIRLIGTVTGETPQYKTLNRVQVFPQSFPISVAEKRAMVNWAKKSKFPIPDWAR